MPSENKEQDTEQNTEQGYGLVSKLLHWSVAALMLFLLWLGWYMVDLSYYDPQSKSALYWHQLLGLWVFALAVMFIVWRVIWCVASKPPAFSLGVKPWEKIAASLAHTLLFGLMLLLPISGYLISTSEGEGIALFFGLDFPALLPVSESLREWAVDGHYLMAYGGLGLIALHVLAALKHHFVSGDDTLRKML